MKIAGLQKLTLIDFPGLVACTVFTAGCNLRCPWCHNGAILGAMADEDLMPQNAFFDFLAKRRKVLDGVVISGGEPTLQPDLKDFIAAIKDLGLAVKLDSNGTAPQVMEELLDQGLPDYVAMDVKAAPSHYEEAAGLRVAETALTRSIEVIRTKAKDYEFRVTLVPGIHDESSVAELGRFLRQGPLYLQNFETALGAPNEKFRTISGFTPSQMERFADILKSIMTGKICVRNL